MKKKIEAHDAPKAPGLLSPAIESNGFIFVSGQIHIAGGKLVGDTTEEKVTQVMKNISNILKEAGANLNDVVKATVYVTDMGIYPDFNKAYATYFTEPLPAREVVCVKELPLGADIEISVIAEKTA
jgi:2-iminobutanoate/2-iminopropanoate deaminase